MNKSRNYCLFSLFLCLITLTGCGLELLGGAAYTRYKLLGHVLPLNEHEKQERTCQAVYPGLVIKNSDGKSDISKCLEQMEIDKTYLPKQQTEVIK